MILYDRNDLLFAVGPAGSGKTYTAIALAVRALKEKQVRRIILTRPAVEAGEKLGFLPGDMKEKLDPYLQPLYDALTSMDGELWKQMPYSASSSATIEQADKIYCKERSDTDALKFLRESKGQPPIERKKNLTLEQCRSFVNAALIAKDG